MGQDAGVFVWYGIVFVGDDWELQEKLEEEARKREEETPYEWKVNGVELRLMTCDDNGDPVGFGCEIFYHDWDYAPKVFTEVVKEVEQALSSSLMNEVDKVLDEFGATQKVHKRGLYLHTRLW
jgi:hypothetical protein